MNLNENATYQDALFALSVPSTVHSSRMSALRILARHVESQHQIDSYTRQNINQTVLDNVLEIILREDRSTDLQERQLIRTECFLILARLLESNTLFGNIKDVVNKLIAVNEEKGVDVSQAAIIEQASSQQDVSSVGSFKTLSSRNSAGVSTTQTEMSKSIKLDASSSVKDSPSKISEPVLSKSLSDLSLLRKNLKTPKSRLLVKNMKRRPSVLVHERFQMDNIVPGADPSNYFEQDRKLGYQKSRMWFPIPHSNPRSLVPRDRPGPSTQMLPNTVVNEYVQMRALLSYVSDLVAPHAPEPRHRGLAQILPTGGYIKRTKGTMNPLRYDEAMQQAITIWTPLVGSHLPQWARKKRKYTELHKKAEHLHLEAGLAAAAEEYTATMRVSPSHDSSCPSPLRSGHTLDDSSSLVSSQSKATASTSAQASTVSLAREGRHTSNRQSTDPLKTEKPLTEIPTGFRSIEKQIIFTKKVLRRLLRNELQTSKLTKTTLRETLDVVLQETTIEKETVEKFQKKMQGDLGRQAETLQSSIDAIKSLTKETIKMQYTLLPPRYLLIVDGKRANPRKQIAHLVNRFCRIRRLSFLAQALGIWKICLVEDESLANRPKYAKMASLHLMAGWVQNVKFKRLKTWTEKWSREVSYMIYMERSLSVVPMQTLYRRWRDRRKFIQMHRISIYNGPLSDIYLAPKRKGLRYFIPDIIRDQRRVVWRAASLVQSAWRGKKIWKIFQVRKKQIIRIQSMGRMWPIRSWYKKLRVTTIKAQAWARRTVRRIQYLRWKFCSVIVQKYIRRYLAQMRRWRMHLKIWASAEARIVSSIKIQCRWRIIKARRRVQRIKWYRNRRQWASLVLQKNWYNSKNAFHTFLLMSCYRELERENREFDDFVNQRERMYCARKIQRRYRIRYNKRMISAVIKVQCWFRGRLGYNLVDLLRKEMWASRKLHHWARAKLRRMNARIRKIQLWWWRLKKGRLLRHLGFRAYAADVEDDRKLVVKHYYAASRMQAFARGVWCRRWVVRHKAAMTIQRPMRFYLARLRWKAEVRERNIGAFRRYVDKLINRVVQDRTYILVRIHTKMLIKPQALIRGFLVRLAMRRAREFGYKLGLAVVRIQRFWRKSGSLGQAVEEMMALRRADINPFRHLSTIHEVLMQCRQETNKYFNVTDPRVGLRISSFLHRTGHLELLEMFPKKHFLNLLDMKQITLEKLSKLYRSFTTKNKGNAGSNNNNKTGEKQSLAQQQGKQKEPVNVFNAILKVLAPPICPRLPDDRYAIAAVAPVQETISPDEFCEYVEKNFLKKFGKTLTIRARNLAKSLAEQSWSEYCNFHCVANCFTRAQMYQAIATATDSADVKAVLEEIRHPGAARGTPADIEEDNAWDRNRVKASADLCQFAIDRLKSMLPPEGALAVLVDKTVSRIVTYKRKFAYISQRVKREFAAARKTAMAKLGKEPTVMEMLSQVEKSEKEKNVSRRLRRQSSLLEELGIEDPEAEKWLLTEETRSTVLTTEQSLDLEFRGTPEDLELEFNISVCKLYSDLLDKLLIATKGVQSIKASWSNHTLRRVVKKTKLDMFLNQTKADYLKYRRTNHVEAVWKKFRRIEIAKHRLELIMEAVLQKKAAILQQLEWIYRYGWGMGTGTQESLWVDYLGRYPPQVEAPHYSLVQWRAACRIQRRGRILLEALRKRRELKENARLADLGVIQARIEGESELASKGHAVLASLRLVSRSMLELTDRKTLGIKLRHVGSNDSNRPEVDGGEGADGDTLTGEESLPYRLQLYREPNLTSGSWSLFQLKEGGDKYETVLVFRIRNGGKSCDIKAISGKKQTDIPATRIFQMNLEQGTVVEVRHKGHLDFYRGKIMSVVTGFDGKKRYSVIYDDGDKEDNVPREFIRFTSGALNGLLKERMEHVAANEAYRKRAEHFVNLKKERHRRCLEELMAASDAESRDSFSPLSQDASLASSLVSRFTPTSSPTKKQTPSLRDGSSGNSTKQASTKQASTKKDKSSLSGSNSTHQSPLVRELDVSREDEDALEVMEIQFAVKYIRALRYGWVLDRRGGHIMYRNVNELSTTYALPRYTAEEEFWATKIQTVFRMRLSKKKFLKTVFKSSISSIINRTIMKTKKIAFVGYQLEGVTPFMMLRRLGFCDVADSISTHFAKKNLQTSISMEKVAGLQQKDYGDYGIVQRPELIQELVRFQNWWHKTQPADRNRAMELINYYSSPDDPRSIQQCIQDSEEPLIVAKFLKMFQAHESKTRAACKAIAKSKFPLGRMQFESYLTRHSGAGELARAHVLDLVDKPTTHTWVEEAKALKVLRNAVRQIGSIIGILKMKSIRRVITNEEARSDAIAATASRLNVQGERPLCSGPEAKAALVMRNALDYMKSVIKACVLVQRRTRCFITRRFYLRWLHARRVGILLMQRVARGFLGRAAARYLRRQQASEWEQLWDSKRQLMYYYSRLTLSSVYVEPPGPFRPLVRDRLSAMLVQAWPMLDKLRGGSLLQKLPISADVLEQWEAISQAGSSASSITKVVVQPPALLKCRTCNLRRCVRLCLDCVPNVAGEDDSTQANFEGPEHGVPYCFACFNTMHHGDDPRFAFHRFDDAREADDVHDFLHCCVCNEPATRKCLGLITDDQLNDLCNELQRAPPDRWAPILQNANMGSDEKLATIIGSLDIRADQKLLTPAQLQLVRTALERTRAECDECYCENCYMMIHSKGRRLLHRWKGFQPLSAICSVCTRSPAELSCGDCNGATYCESCFGVFHGMGKKRRHRKALIIEKGDDGQPLSAELLCSVCSRRRAVVNCKNYECETKACDSCFECIHQPFCDGQRRKPGTAAAAARPRKGVTTAPTVSAGALVGTSPRPAVFECVGCGEAADKQCQQCGDYYCSLTWMGNDGCFLRFHSKGNRATHTTVRLVTAPSVEESKSVPTSKHNRRERRGVGKTEPGTKTRSGAV